MRTEKHVNFLTLLLMLSMTMWRINTACESAAALLAHAVVDLDGIIHTYSVPREQDPPFGAILSSLNRFSINFLFESA